MMNEVFLVTGGEGFIGRNIISRIRDLGGEAYSLDIAGKPDFKISTTDRRKFNDVRTILGRITKPIRNACLTFKYLGSHIITQYGS